MIEINGKLNNIFHLHIYLLYVHGWQWVHSTPNAEAEAEAQKKSEIEYHVFRIDSVSHESWKQWKNSRNKMQWISFVWLLLLSRIVQNPHITPSSLTHFHFGAVKFPFMAPCVMMIKSIELRENLGDIMNFLRKVIHWSLSVRMKMARWHGISDWWNTTKWYQNGIARRSRESDTRKMTNHFDLLHQSIIKSTEIKLYFSSKNDCN